jgi:pyruvate dehydrogenase E2 component (dihydrolipoamide acetyltransferase)
MPAVVIMPALELAQDSGKVLQWLKAPGDLVRKGEPIVEIETDKATVEIEAPADGVLREVTASAGDVVPVGQTIALIYGVGEAGPTPAAAPVSPPAGVAGSSPAAAAATSPRISPLARKVAEQHGVDLAHLTASGGRIEKADVLAFVERRSASRPASPAAPVAGSGPIARLLPASPKARRLATERGLEVSALRGSGPGGAVLAIDVLGAGPGTATPSPTLPAVSAPRVAAAAASAPGSGGPRVGTIWRVMVERMTQSWTTAPQFHLVREVNASRLTAWRERAVKGTGVRVTYTDLLVRLVAAAITRHPGVNASWRDGAIARNADVNIGLAVAIDDGLVVPVIHRADTLGLAELVAEREALVGRAQAGRLRPADITGGGFTISNLGMYGVDGFTAIVNPPQAAILAVGRIADRVVAVNGRPDVQPMMVLTLSCDHRALDGARGAQFLATLAELIEEPLALLS